MSLQGSPPTRQGKGVQKTMHSMARSFARSAAVLFVPPCVGSFRCPPLTSGSWLQQQQANEKGMVTGPTTTHKHPKASASQRQLKQTASSALQFLLPCLFLPVVAVSPHAGWRRAVFVTFVWHAYKNWPSLSIRVQSSLCRLICSGRSRWGAKLDVLVSVFRCADQFM